MKIAISSSGQKLTDSVSEIFARCPYFVIAEIENKRIQKTEVVGNKIADQLGQAGISAAQLMAEKDVKTVITKNVGPRALDVLNQFQIGVYTGEGSIEKVLQEFIDEKLKRIN